MDDLISRQAAIDRIEEHLRCGDELYPLTETDKILNHAFEIAASCVYNLPSAQSEITDEQAIEHLQDSGWMQNHDKQMYEMGLRENLSDDGDSYDALLPSAQPEPRWIPVTERLPEKHEEVLVTVAGEIVIAWLYIDGRWRSNDCPETYLNNYITAWMPFPEPYREEGGADA